MLVTAMMITGKHPDRIKMAKVAVRCFLEQTHREKELIIINDGRIALGCEDRSVHEFMLPYSAKTTLGDLRNLALERARGDLVLLWDDDDWHHPARMETQAAAWEKGLPVLLKKQVRYNFLNGAAFVHESASGINGTMLHERNCGVRYPSVRKGEDTHFLAAFPRRKVIDAPPSLHIRFYHGGNTWDGEFIMHEYHSDEVRGKWKLPAADARLLRSVLKKCYGIGNR
jgi:glycosyltransferase involved in cell wall biosynthesis